jgi:6-phosphogluconolactonase
VFFCNERQGGKTFQGDMKDFMGPCKVPVGNCYYIEDWSNPPASAAQYEEMMMKSNVLTKSNGAPSFDLILMGTGDDGHCASINPNTDEAKAKSGWVLPIAEVPGKPGGMTISIFTINAAKRVVVSAAEPKRAEMVKRGLTGVFPEFDCPAGLVSTKNGAKVTWVCDVDSIKAYKAK